MESISRNILVRVFLHYCFIFVFIILIYPTDTMAQGVYYVATDGSDDTGDGTTGKPWRASTRDRTPRDDRA